MKLDENKKTEQQILADANIFKTIVFGKKAVDEMIQDSFDSIARDDLKVGGLIDELMTIIQSAITEEEDGFANLAFYAPVLAELFKSSAEFKKQKTDLLNTIHKYINTEYKKNGEDKGIGEDIITMAYRDIQKRKAENEK